MRLYLIRHAQTAWNAEGRAQGHTDIPLDEIGHKQARALGASFAAVQVDRVLTSDLERSIITAGRVAAATGAKLSLRPALRERSFGDWEGKGFEEIQRLVRESGESPFELRPPGGESFHDVWDRLTPVLEEVTGSHAQTLAVVTHGGTCALFLARLLRGSIQTSRSFRFANTGVTELQLRPDGLFLMVRYN
ncbi:MAG TPA: histidine phosphatase family protein, partial [Fimbriimonadaceae bacterium]|nr:histidine phosphatase family protein [Fimbriimonadaceae bacterium]